jgi:hypothetical protein
MYKPNRENWVVEVTVKDLYDAISHRNSKQLKYWEQFLLLMEPDRKLFLQYDDYVFFFGE